LRWTGSVTTFLGGAAPLSTRRVRCYLVQAAFAGTDLPKIDWPPVYDEDFPMAETAVDTSPRVALTESAAKRVLQLIETEGKPNMMLRVTVSGGGCSGFQYGITLDDTQADGDLIFTEHGVSLVTDETSLELLQGSVVDFVQDLIGASFQIRNPNASSTCGCGSSFSV
jgi:iron-sulfur cluster insertion protein